MVEELNNVVSVDFDFWVRVAPREMAMLDWAHKENLFFIDVIWQIRACGQAAQGQDIRDICGIAKDEPEPDILATLFHKHKLKVRKNQILVTESHALALPWFAGMENLHLWHIDAHHDFGYDMEEPNCDNWVDGLVKKGGVKAITLIYPKWRIEEGKKHNFDWGDRPAKKVARWRKKGIDVQIVYGLAENLPSNMTFRKMFMCRSGSWSPPWCDDNFRNMVFGFMVGDHRSLQFRAHCSFDEMLNRKLDWDAIKKQGAQEAVMLAAAREANRKLEVG